MATAWFLCGTVGLLPTVRSAENLQVRMLKPTRLVAISLDDQIDALTRLPSSHAGCSCRRHAFHACADALHRRARKALSCSKAVPCHTGVRSGTLGDTCGQRERT